MSKKVVLAIIIGLAAGLIDLIPLVMVKVPLLNMISILLFWIITSYFVAHVTLFKNSLLNGLVLSTLNMLPLVAIIYTINPKDFLPMLSMALILGPLVGYLNGRFNQ
ncbi:hypothetical protein [Acidaminobacter sp.]|uniref:hypothetical protein n=1 Tax=Acidaminobacter sp. TaxID=1872102 RepID=UPI0025605C78|nr:hypothetical protein [Acidaminobacter sp.]MDK9711928.1 hypothetical protein [Acidaminobacter sp.]